MTENNHNPSITVRYDGIDRSGRQYTVISVNGNGEQQHRDTSLLPALSSFITFLRAHPTEVEFGYKGTFPPCERALFEGIETIHKQTREQGLEQLIK